MIDQQQQTLSAPTNDRIVVGATVTIQLSDALRRELRDFLGSSASEHENFAYGLLLRLGLTKALELEALLPKGSPEAVTPVDSLHLRRIASGVWEEL